MNVGRFATHLAFSLVAALALVSLSSSRALAADDQTTSASQHHHPGPDQKSDLVKLVREVTERFKDVSVAQAEKYELVFGCVSGDAGGAMGMHFANLETAFDDVLDPARPEIVIYEPTSRGLRLIGADYIILADKWHETHPPTETPQIMGQLLHRFDAPNRFGMPAFYTLHVWAWKENPTGTFVNWHSKVSCDAFSG
jgi:hypothetical protein